MFGKIKNKNKKLFRRSCLQCFGSENVLIKHKEDSLSINVKQLVKLEERIIEFENCFKQIPIPFNIFTDFECNLRGVESYEGSYAKKYQASVPCSFDFKVVCVNDRFTKPIVIYRGENAAYEFIKAILKEYKHCKKVMNKHFNKNLIMSIEDEHLFQQSNSCWICKKLIDNDEEKVKDHCHVTGKFRGVARGNCNINLQLTKKVSVIFHDLRGYDSHLSFTFLVFIDSMQFMNSSLDEPVKNMSDEYFKYLEEEFGSENLELLKQKGNYPYEYINSFERFNDEKLAPRKYFYSSTKDGKIGDDGKFQMVT